MDQIFLGAGFQTGLAVRTRLIRPRLAMVLEVLRVDEALQIDENLELLETQLTSSEMFTALFELEITGRVRCMPGKNYVRVM